MSGQGRKLYCTIYFEIIALTFTALHSYVVHQLCVNFAHNNPYKQDCTDGRSRVIRGSHGLLNSKKAASRPAVGKVSCYAVPVTPIFDLKFSCPVGAMAGGCSNGSGRGAASTSRATNQAQACVRVPSPAGPPAVDDLCWHHWGATGAGRRVDWGLRHARRREGVSNSGRHGTGARMQMPPCRGVER